MRTTRGLLYKEIVDEVFNEDDPEKRQHNFEKQLLKQDMTWCIIEHIWNNCEHNECE